MANVTPIKLSGNFHSPFVAGDTIDSALLKIVSTDAGNDISVGSDGAAFFDLDSATMTEKVQDAVGNILQSPLAYNDLLNQISSTAISSVAVGAGLSGDGLSGNPVSPDFDSLPNAAAGNLPVGTKFVISGGNGELATSAQVSQSIASDIQSNLVKGDLVAGTNVSFTGTATGRLLGSGNLTIDVSGAAPTGTAGGDLNGSYPNPTVDAIQGTPVTTTAPTVNQALVFDGTQYVPATVALFAPATTPLPTSANNSGVPTQYFGQSNDYYLGEPKAWVRMASALSSTGFLAYPLFEVA